MAKGPAASSSRWSCLATPSLPRAPGSFVNFPEPRLHAGRDGPASVRALGWVPGPQLMARSPGSFSFAGIRTPRSVSSPARCVRFIPRSGNQLGALGLEPRKVLKGDRAPQEQWAHPESSGPSGLGLTTPTRSSGYSQCACGLSGRGAALSACLLGSGAGPTGPYIPPALPLESINLWPDLWCSGRGVWIPGARRNSGQGLGI